MAAITSPASSKNHNRPTHLRVVSPAERIARPVTAATYRRRRFVAAVVAIGLAVGLSFVMGRLGGGPLAPSQPARAATLIQGVSADTYVVQPGDTIWKIARQVQPRGDVRPLVQLIGQSRQGQPLRVGERILLP